MSNAALPASSSLADQDLRRLSTINAAAITLAGAVLLAIIAYSGWASNQSSTARERTLLQNALNLGIARALNEQKSVAWWDESVLKITDEHVDLEFADSEFGVFLTETYGHDAVYILNGQDKPLYAFTNGARAEPSAYGLHRALLSPLIAEVRGEGQPELAPRPDTFGADQKNYRTLGAALASARWAGHIISIDGKLAVVAALTIVPNIDMSLLSQTPNIVVSVTYIDNDYVAELGRSLLLNGLALSKKPIDRAGMVSEPFGGDDGSQVGFLTWKTEQPGRYLLTFILPLVAIGVLAVAILANGMMRRLKESSSELSEREKQLRHDARHDALSDLANRQHFAEKLQEALTGLADDEAGAQVVVAYVDVDHFKDVNDTLGHHAGDELIKIVARRLQVNLESGHLLSRYGGDEFAILAPAVTDTAVMTLGERIQKAFASHFDVNGQRLFVSASAGIAMSKPGEATVETLMRQADIALYEAKSQGRARTVCFSSEMGRRVEERRAIEVDLREALAAEGLRLNYQPIISCQTGAITGVEALLRWRHPTRGDISPAMFIPIAEQSGLMPALGEWVLRRAMMDHHLWPQLQVSVNLSPVQFRQAGLVALLQYLVNEQGVDPRRFVLEITEGVLMEACDRTANTLEAIHDMGFQTALDDFGTGYSSLSYLCNFRFDKIKIDRSFVSGMSKSENYTKIVHAVVALGRGLGMRIVAEGVETEAEAAVMTGMGCTELQGYYFSRPVETAQMGHLLETFVAKPIAKPPSSLAEVGARAGAG